VRCGVLEPNVIVEYCGNRGTVVREGLNRCPSTKGGATGSRAAGRHNEPFIITCHKREFVFKTEVVPMKTRDCFLLTSKFSLC
jgi:hypothetical protein